MHCQVEDESLDYQTIEQACNDYDYQDSKIKDNLPSPYAKAGVQTRQSLKRLKPNKYQHGNDFIQLPPIPPPEPAPRQQASHVKNPKKRKNNDERSIGERVQRIFA